MKTYKPNFAELNKLSEQGYLRKVISPCGKLVLYNYTDKCVYEKMWNKHTLNSRGSVYELSTGKAVTRAFPKFFNFSELPPAKQKTILNSSGVYGKYKSFEKADGSLGIIYYYDGKWNVNTRGSFTSDQAVRAEHILNTKIPREELNSSITYLCEIIYPENKIIVNYGDREDLILLAAFHTESGEEVDLEIFTHPFSEAQKYPYTISEMIALQETLPKDEEGFVVRFSNGERVKFKGKEYLQIARILQGCSPLALWEKMSNGKVCKEFLATIPEEILPEINDVVIQLEGRYQLVGISIYSDIRYIRQSLYIPDDGTELSVDQRKEVGLFIKKEKLNHEAAVFPFLLRKKDAVEKYIMKQIRPTGNSL